ncbi:MAG TPA: radical SAM protein [Terriglobales bacterium]|jgi:radical SAM protein with 4Fe4S-binding SPASM domain|nr:radical SAM protein [Terriglobales bacterium]
MSLLNEMSQKAFDLGVPISVHMDVTYRCNERCVHCYLDHDDHGEMTTAEIKGVLDQLAEAGVFFLTFSGGEVFMRRDFFEILEHARRLMFNVKIKTNAVMIHESEAQRIRELGVDTIQISVYSHKAEVHDAITKLPGSFERSIKAIRFMREQGLKVTIANVLMTWNRHDSDGVQELAVSLGAHYTLDPTITPMMDGNTSVLSLRIAGEELPSVFANPKLVPNMEEFCAPPKPVTDDDMEGYSCSAGHSFCYISPYGDVFPCVQFPLPTGNIRRQKFMDIWNHSPEMNEVRSIKAKDLTVCSSCSHVSSCTRCPGLAYMEGSMRGPSTADCEKSYYRTGVPTANMLRKAGQAKVSSLVQIRPVAALA